MKRRISICLALVMILSVAFSVNIFASDGVSVYVDNELTRLTDANGNTVYPFIQNGTTYIPVRGISQALDCRVEWDGDNQNVMIYKDMEPDGSVFRNRSGEIKIYVDNDEKTLYDANGTVVKPFIKNGTTYVPLRGVSKTLGYYVEWEGRTQSVYVWKDIVSPNGVPLDFLRPYESDCMRTYYESEGELIEIDGENYTNALENYWGSWSTATAMFNLDGKYNSISCVLGLTTDHSDVDYKVSFVVDGKNIKTVSLDENSITEEIVVNLNQALQLKIMIDGRVALGDITFYGD